MKPSMHSMLLAITVSILSSIQRCTSFSTNYHVGKLSSPSADKRTQNFRYRTPFLLHSAPPRRTRIEDDRDHYFHNLKDLQDGDQKAYKPQSKSIEKSCFWYNVPSKPALSQEEVVPYQSKLDTTGKLPFGSYKLLGKEEYESKRTCVLSVALDFWSGRSADDNSASALSIDTGQVIKNVHQLIDSGFTSFQLYNAKPLPTELSAPGSSMSMRSYNHRSMDPSWKQTFTEQQIYQQLIKQTPSSVVNQCSFATRINIPPLEKVASYNNNYSGSNNSASASHFSQRTVREHVGQSIMNMYSNTNGCLDNIQLNFQSDLLHIGGKGNAEVTGDYMDFQQQQKPRLSPYTFDILDVLSDMQREGYIRSISGLNFPSYSVDEIEENGFELDYNQITCSLLDPTSYTKNQNKKEKRAVLSGALAGGLLTNRYSNVPNSHLSRSGEPISHFMSKSEHWHYNNVLIKSWGPYHRKRGSRRGDGNIWQMFQSNVMKALEDIAYKHQVSIASVILRWSIQLENVGSVVVGSSLNTNFDDDDRPYTRPNDLRKVCSFVLDEEDMERLWDVAGADKMEYNNMNNDLYGGMDGIDFGNTKLWL